MFLDDEFSLENIHNEPVMAICYLSTSDGVTDMKHKDTNPKLTKESNMEKTNSLSENQN